MSVRLPSSALPIAAAIVLFLSLAGIAHAGQTADAIVVTIPSQFPLSGPAELTSTGSTAGAVAGNIQIIHTDTASFLLIPAVSAENGARLTSLRDSETGVVFRNNTIALPVVKDSDVIARLVLATDEMIAGRDGYTGRITGVELDIPGGERTVDGHRFSAGTAIFLKSLPQGIAYRMVTTEGQDMKRAIDAALEPAGLAPPAVPLAIEVDGVDQKSRSMIEFIIVSVSTDQDWVEKYCSDNITIYGRHDTSVVPVATRLVKADDNTTVVYQAVVSGPGRFALAAAGEKPGSGLEWSISGAGEVLIFGGLLTVLISGLIIMVRRVLKK
ncbi:hypothetical protein [Methanocella arvoryzae]|uniref:Uncharacterized protein n=1 Tax=Methanocella arvoryzae (strain DSM 22066 / NBRC 105507 / MRE50) TaxID=351160 RepID=Q0W3B1_METAR|nr:hypothetical protein [Methanocella arvoryzae]CAJ37132.1 hypothetical protein RCIX1970 [Methanocella arvoryzae MRE50]